MSAGNQIDRLTSEYLPRVQGIEELFENETDKLLYGVLVELQIQNGRKPADVVLDDQERADRVPTGNYESHEVTVDSTDWGDPIELDRDTESVDLRNFSNGIEVAFKDPKKHSNAKVPYASGDAPVVGIPVRTARVWLRKQSGASDSTVRLDAWG